MYFRFGFRTNDFRVIKTARLSISFSLRSIGFLPSFFFLSCASFIDLHRSRYSTRNFSRVKEGCSRRGSRSRTRFCSRGFLERRHRETLDLSLSLSFVYSPFSRSSLVPKLFSAGEKLKLARLPSTDDIEAPFQVSWCTGGEALARAPTKIILDLSWRAHWNANSGKLDATHCATWVAGTAHGETTIEKHNQSSSMRPIQNTLDSWNACAQCYW